VKKIKLYWCRGKGRADEAQRNFGDYLSPILVEMVSNKRVVYSPVDRADLMAIGSILSRERKAKRFFIPRRMHIWGTGTEAEGRSFSGRHYYHAVRGVKTLEQIKGLKSTPALGDPGLLVSEYWSGRTVPEKKYKLGFIPHYVDKGHPFVSFLGSMPGVKLIDVYWGVDDVLRSVLSCDFIISSSMHGLIVADSFGIPSRRVRLSKDKISDYKFEDYYTGVGVAMPDTLDVAQVLDFGVSDFCDLLERSPALDLDSIKQGLICSFPEF